MKTFLYSLKSLFGALAPLAAQYLLVAVLWVFGVLVSVLFGAVIGWFVGLFFGKTILAVLAGIGIKGFSMWQIGATLGFLGGFFNRKVNINDARNKQ